MGLCGVAAHQLTGIVNPDFFLCVHCCTLHLCAVQTWSICIEGKTDGIKNGRFSCPRLAGDKENLAINQWLGLKVDDCILDRCNIVYTEFFEFHSALHLRFYNLSSSLIAASVS